MLVLDPHRIGEKLFHFRKQLGMTQAEAAEAAGLSDRTYADIERGSVNMRVETMLRICAVFHITPNDILSEKPTDLALPSDDLFHRLQLCDYNTRENALKILSIFLNSVQHDS